MYRGKTVVDTKLFPNPSENFILAFNKIPISWVHITCGKFMYIPPVSCIYIYIEAVPPQNILDQYIKSSSLRHPVTTKAKQYMFFFLLLVLCVPICLQTLRALLQLFFI